MKENKHGKNRQNNNEKKDKKFYKKPLLNLPFFAYGIFKPWTDCIFKNKGP